MTVKDLIDALKQYPDDTAVYVSTECCGCFEKADHVDLDERGMVVIDGGKPQP